jgi:HAD superfamily hydrolase (TIGR01662 family)
MALTSAAIPPMATWHWLRGVVGHRRVQKWRGLPDLVLFDRDGTLVHDFPYNGDPEWVRPVSGAKESLDLLRARGVRVGVVSNQSGVARGLITQEQVDACMARLAELLGPFATVQTCPHGPDDGCTCRKPAPGMVKSACAELDVDPSRCVVIGDIGSDVEARPPREPSASSCPPRSPGSRRSRTRRAGRPRWRTRSTTSWREDGDPDRPRRPAGQRRGRPPAGPARAGRRRRR